MPPILIRWIYSRRPCRRSSLLHDMMDIWCYRKWPKSLISWDWPVDKVSLLIFDTGYHALPAQPVPHHERSDEPGHDNIIEEVKEIYKIAKKAIRWLKENEASSLFTSMQWRHGLNIAASSQLGPLVYQESEGADYELPAGSHFISGCHLAPSSASIRHHRPLKPIIACRSNFQPASTINYFAPHFLVFIITAFISESLRRHSPM